MKNKNKIFVITAQSQAHLGECVIGYGKSKAQAIMDAYGRKQSLAKSHRIEERNEDEFHENNY